MTKGTKVAVGLGVRVDVAVAVCVAVLWIVEVGVAAGCATPACGVEPTPQVAMARIIMTNTVRTKTGVFKNGSILQN